MLTTGQAAAMAGCARETIVRWFEAGRFLGTKLPGSGVRRINERSFREFARANKIELKELEEVCHKTETMQSPNSPKRSSRLPRRRTTRPPS